MGQPADEAPSRRERARAATFGEIKRTARRVLVRSGPDGLALRAVAREMGMTAPALYRYFDNRELRRNPAFDIEDWYQGDTVGYIGGFFSHAHWNERYLADDLRPRL